MMVSLEVLKVNVSLLKEKHDKLMCHDMNEIHPPEVFMGGHVLG